MFIWGERDKTCPMKKDEQSKDVKILKDCVAGHADVIQDYCIDEYQDELLEWIKSDI